MHGDYLTLAEKSNVLLGDGSMDPAVTNVRSSPSTGSNRIDQLRRGQTVNIIGFNSGWYKVRYNNTTGYIRSDLVTLLEKPEGNKGSAATTNSGNGGSSSSGNVAPTNNVGSQIATYAQQYVGYPYVYGGEGPSGFDCSGFVQYVYGQFGYSLNRTATAQLQNGYWVSYDELQPGDIIYFGTTAGKASHVGIYIGDGNFVHAQNSSTGVVIPSLSTSWYANRYLCAHRIVN